MSASNRDLTEVQNSSLFGLDEKVNYLLKRHLDLPATMNQKEYYQEDNTLSKKKNIYENQLLNDSVPNEAPVNLRSILTRDADSEWRIIDHENLPQLSALPANRRANVYAYHDTEYPTVVKYVHLKLRPLEENRFSYSHPLLKDIIPASTHSTYRYHLYDSEGREIGPTEGNWILDSDTGILSFYNYETLTTEVTVRKAPTLTCYVYSGRRGVVSNVFRTDGMNIDGIQNSQSMQWDDRTSAFVPIDGWRVHLYGDGDQDRERAIAENVMYRPEGKVVIGGEYPRTGVDFCDAPVEYTLDVSGNIGCSDQIHCEEIMTRSDARTKKDIETIDDRVVVEAMKQVRPVSFTWKDKPEKGNQYGFIAQEMEALIPEVVREDATGKKGILYERFVPFLTRYVQVQQQQIDEMRQRIRELEGKMRV